MKRSLVFLFLVLLFPITLPIQVQAISRITQDLNDSPTFSWSKSYSFEHGSFAVAVQVPMALSFRGLPNKIMPGESFSVDIGMGFGTGAIFTVGGTSFSLDPVMPIFQDYLRQVDLTPIAALVVAAVSDLAADTVAPGAGEVIANIAYDLVRENTEMYLINQLLVDIGTNGPISTSMTSLDAWSGRSQPFSVSVSPTAQRGQTASLAFTYKYSLTLHIDFKDKLYNDGVVGSIFTKIASVLKLPWEPSLGFNLPTGQPSISSRVIIPDFTISASTSTINIRQGDSGDVTISLSPIDEFDSTVSLEAVGVPAGCLATFSSTSSVPPTSSAMRLSITLSAPEGSHTISIVGQGGGKTHQTSVTVVITTPPPSTPTPTISQYPSQPSQPENEQSSFPFIFIILVVLATIAFLGIALTRTRGRKRVSGIATPQEPSHRPIAYPSKQRPMYTTLPKGRQFCPFCGGRVGSKDRFCSNCGSLIINH